MEKVAAAAVVSPSDTSSFVSWEEVFVSSDKGRREVHYYLKRRDASSDLAVIGKEKSLRHMSYHYAIRNRSILALVPSASMIKLKSRREVVDWLNSIVSVSSSHESLRPAGGSLDDHDACELDTESFKDVQLWKPDRYTKELLWLGSPWICRKRRRHYESFRRNGVKISVHDFVFVLAEEDKRLVAYLEDMYEDSRGNKMVMVRWFHKIDEVGIALPHNFNDREIFFSLCLQDLSIECIDGLATVLSPQHFEKFLNEARHTQLQPFVCHKQFENEDVKPFDITRVKGYWKQEILRYMYTSHSKSHVNSHPSDDVLKVDGNASDAVETRPKKRQHRSKDDDVYLQCTVKKEPTDATCANMQNLSKISIDCKNGTELCGRRHGDSDGILFREDGIKNPQYLAVGSPVEVLSQDSGIRGCWLRALVIKKCKDKVKVQYQDIQDAADEANKLEEWILASRVAAIDPLGVRICGRTTIRPLPQSNEGRVLWVVDVGTLVDVWWHDGWWEGIVIGKESEDKLRVYFPGEMRHSVFSPNDLRHSQEWLGNRWTCIKERPDLVNSLFSLSESKQAVGVSADDGRLPQGAICDGGESRKDEAEFTNSHLENKNEKAKELVVVPDLANDNMLAQLKWKSSKKRRRASGSSVWKLQYGDNDIKSTVEVMGSENCERFLIPSSLKVDHENCKYIGDSHFCSPVVPLTSLVMSR